MKRIFLIGIISCFMVGFAQGAAASPMAASEEMVKTEVANRISERWHLLGGSRSSFTPEILRKVLGKTIQRSVEWELGNQPALTSAKPHDENLYKKDKMLESANEGRLWSSLSKYHRSMKVLDRLTRSTVVNERNLKQFLNAQNLMLSDKKRALDAQKRKELRQQLFSKGVALTIKEEEAAKQQALSYAMKQERDQQALLSVQEALGVEARQKSVEMQTLLYAIEQERDKRALLSVQETFGMEARQKSAELQELLNAMEQERVKQTATAYFKILKLTEVQPKGC